MVGQYSLIFSHWAMLYLLYHNTACAVDYVMTMNTNCSFIEIIPLQMLHFIGISSEDARSEKCETPIKGIRHCSLQFRRDSHCPNMFTIYVSSFLRHSWWAVCRRERVWEASILHELQIYISRICKNNARTKNMGNLSYYSQKITLLFLYKWLNRHNYTLKWPILSKMVNARRRFIRSL